MEESPACQMPCPGLCRSGSPSPPPCSDTGYPRDALPGPQDCPLGTAPPLPRAAGTKRAHLTQGRPRACSPARVPVVGRKRGGLCVECESVRKNRQ